MVTSGRTTDKVQFSVYFEPQLFQHLEEKRGKEKRSTYLEKMFAKIAGATA